MQVVKEQGGKVMAMQAVEHQVFFGLAFRILKSLSEGNKYPKQIARELRTQEQKVYYHMRRLEKKGFVHVVAREEVGGALAKVYAITSPAFVVRFGEFLESARLPRDSGTLAPFVANGELNAKIVVGSPDPHGPQMARSRDITYAVELALFLGTFLSKKRGPAVVEDKNLTDMDSNLIVIGGPVTNRITKMVNEKMPVRFDRARNIVAGRKTFRADECGFVARMDNPFHRNKKMIVIAGKRYSGTKAAVLAFIQEFEAVMKKPYTIVEGVDNDGDGEVDSVRIMN